MALERLSRGIGMETRYMKLQNLKLYCEEMALGSVSADEKAFWLDRAETVQGKMDNISIEDAQAVIQ